MTIQQLQTILNYANVQSDQKVRVKVVGTNGGVELCEIVSFDSFCDGILLNIYSGLLDEEK